KKFEGNAGDTIGETGTVSFLASDKGPDTTSLRLSQVVRTVDFDTGKDTEWVGGEANRTKMRTSDKNESYTTTAVDTLKSIALRFYGDPARIKEIYDANKAALKSDNPDHVIGAGVALKVPKSVLGGYFMDHMAGDPKAKQRTTKADPNVPQDY